MIIPALQCQYKKNHYWFTADAELNLEIKSHESRPVHVQRIRLVSIEDLPCCRDLFVGKLLLLRPDSVHSLTLSPLGWSDCSCHEETVGVVTELTGLYTPPSPAQPPLSPDKQQVLSITSHIGLSVNISHNIHACQSLSVNI